jgi:hypothetical protein
MSLKLFDQLNRLGVYPDTSALSQEDWLSIVHFYEQNAPERQPPTISADSIKKGTPLFKPFAFWADSGQSPQTTMVKLLPGRKEVWLGTAYKRVEKYNLDGQKKITLKSPSPVVDALDGKMTLYLGIGNMLPNEDHNGRLYTMNDRGSAAKLILDSLHRPVQVLRTDTDRDGIQDLVILEYGYETGQVSIFNGKTATTAVISQQPGARNVVVRDVDKDGWPDLFILFAQAKEQVSLFHNLSGKGFQEEVLVQFPPVYGSSFLDLADMNDDGVEDLIVSFGDNADFSMTKKPFHGIGIYTHNGKGQYQRAWFYPVYGATKTIAGDFDQDGDQDMAMIAFFSEPDPQESFLYFENKGNWQFQVYSVNLPPAKWLVMEAGDVDRDGDLDLILGNLNNNNQALKEQKEKNIKAVWLINTLH